MGEEARCDFAPEGSPEFAVQTRGARTFWRFIGVVSLAAFAAAFLVDPTASATTYAADEGDSPASAPLRDAYRYAAGDADCHLTWTIQQNPPPALRVAYDVASWRLSHAGADISTGSGQTDGILHVRVAASGTIPEDARALIRYQERLVLLERGLAYHPLKPEFRDLQDPGVAAYQATRRPASTLTGVFRPRPDDRGAGTATYLANVLLHEVGHFYGLDHHHGGIMDHRLVDDLSQTRAFDNQVVNAMGC
jgi:hypothetical protein